MPTWVCAPLSPSGPICRIALLATFVPLSACVSHGAHDATVTELARERQTRETLDGRVSDLQAQTQRAEQRIAELENALSAARYEAEVTAHKEQEAKALVEQLQGELGRVGSHIQHYARRNVELEASRNELDELERDVARRLNVFKALSAALGSVSPRSGVAVTTLDGYPAVRFAAGSAVSKRGLNDEAKLAVSTLAELVSADPKGDLVLVHRPSDRTSQSVAAAIAASIGAKAGGRTIEVIEGEAIDGATALAVLHGRSAAGTATRQP
jgi:predicted RNase H-like nuclease (RuvC/YqgF family)